MSVVRNQKEKSLSIDQHGLLSSVLNRFGMEDCKPVTTLLEPEAKFGKLNGNEVEVKLKEFQSVIGSLIYASIGTRPNIMAKVGVLSQHMSNPGKKHWVGVKRVLRNIKETLYYELQYKATNVDGVITVFMIMQMDADWAGDVTTQKLTSGYVFQIGSSTVSWRSKRQSIVAFIN